MLQCSLWFSIYLNQQPFRCNSVPTVIVIANTSSINLYILHRNLISQWAYYCQLSENSELWTGELEKSRNLWSLTGSILLVANRYGSVHLLANKKWFWGCFICYMTISIYGSRCANYLCQLFDQIQATDIILWLFWFFFKKKKDLI